MVFSVFAGYYYSDRCRIDIRCGRCNGTLAGGLGAGFVLAVFMANSGGAWDNAKKYVEEGHLGGKGSECHKGNGNRGYGWRSVQRYFRAEPEYP